MLIRSFPLSSLVARASVLALALFVLQTVGCSQEPTQPAVPSPGGKVIIRITDAPFPFDLVETAAITTDSVTVHLVADDLGQSGFYTIDRERREMNLLDLRNGALETLAAAELPAGVLDQIRLHVSKASVRLRGGRTFPLRIPSGAQSGIKISPSPGVPVGGDGTSEVILDFDVSRSFHSIPDSPKKADDIRGFRFEPVLRVSLAAGSGSVSGRVWNTVGTPDDLSDDVPLPWATVTVLAGSEEVASSATGLDGRYKILGLAPGTYLLSASRNGFTTDSYSIEIRPGVALEDQDLRLMPVE